MDSLTQTALGAAIAQAGFRRRLGGKGVAVGALAGLLPDLDMLAGLFGDEWTTLTHHRGLTHSLLAAPGLAAGAGYLAWRWAGRTGRLGRWVHLVFWVVFTHSLLDWCTTYGTMLFYPLTFRRFANDAVAIIDPLYSLPLFAGLGVALALDRKAGRARATDSQPDARPREPRPGRLWAAGTLAITTLYLLAGWGLSERAVSISRQELARRGFKPVAVRAVPHVAAGLVRRISARDASGDIIVGAVSPFSSAPIGFTRIDWPDDPLAREAVASDRGEVFRWFAGGMLAATVERSSGGATVRLHDQRYGFLSRPKETPFVARFEFDEAGELVRASRVREVSVDLGRELAAAWGVLLGRPVSPAAGPAM
ncbi:MAG: metal-dependent hydrolase [Planctomycetota bacterium]|jgi:inner membrane protein